jgi:peptidoglycan/xylan/chitin deacetylase (PgdA/CDA1 family)
MFAHRSIHATWATVGMLFFKTKRELLGGLPVRHPHYLQSGLSPYLELDGLGEDYRKDPYHFAPTLVRMIADSPNQEIGTHTFSHYYCLEKGETADDFKSDLEATIAVAKQYDLVLRSIVFPRNQYSTSHLAICEELGLAAYRGNPESWFWRPGERNDDSLRRRGVRLLDDYLPLNGHHCWDAAQHRSSSFVNVRASRLLRPVGRRTTPLDYLRLRRIKEDLTWAAQIGHVYHLWWHPENFGECPAQNCEFLEDILNWYDHLRTAEGMQSLTMGELAETVRRKKCSETIPC